MRPNINTLVLNIEKTHDPAPELVTAWAAGQSVVRVFEHDEDGNAAQSAGTTCEEDPD